jgi:uncharacterized damage-inducible protein DinB
LKGNDLLQELRDQHNDSIKILSAIPADAEEFRYADGKWMLKEVVGHLCDTERILTYRALRFSKKDSTELPGFDENSYMENSNFHSRKLTHILNEWNAVRAATLMMFESMSDEMLDHKGIANKVEVSPRTILYFILVHERHHIGIIADRYMANYKKLVI